MLNPQTMEAAVHRYVQALNEADLEAIVNLFDDHATVEDPVGSEVRRGKDAIRAFYAGSVAMKLTVKLEGAIRAVDHEAAFPFSVSFTYNGQATTIHPIDVFRFNDEGRIVQMRAFFGPTNISH